MISRRTLLKTSAAAAALPLLPAIGRAEPDWRAAAETSPLIYLTPIQSNGAESRCQAEIWFASFGGALYVVTATDAWRAQAIRQGLAKARIWVGDVGRWQRADGGHRALPMVGANASIETDAAAHGQVLEVMGGKYSAEWDKWGPRFRNGLADGSRVMLKYEPTA